MAKGETVERALARAGRLAREGAHVEASAAYRAILARFPSNGRARRGLDRLRAPGPIGDTVKTRSGRLLAAAKAAQASGAAGHAAQHFAALVAAHPGEPQLALALGITELQRGRPAAAITPLSAALRLQPTLTAASLHLAHALSRTGETAAAADVCKVALELDPDAADVATLLGELYRALGQPAFALKAFEHALTVAPDHIAARHDRADLLIECGRYKDAAEDAARAVALAPGEVDHVLVLTQALRLARKHRAAIAAVTAALVHLPREPRLLNDLGLLRAELGEAAEAVDAFDQALTLAPDLVSAHSNRALVHRYGPDDPHLHAMAALLDATTDDGARLRLHFALGKALEDAGAIDAAFEQYAAGNALRRAEAPYDRAAAEAEFAAIAKIFADGPFAPFASDGAAGSGPRPIFIVGMPRSGSTLVESILAAHSKVEGVGEPSALKRAVLPFHDALAAGTLTGLGSAALGDMRDAYARSIAQCCASASVVADKQLANYRWLGYAAAAFPDAAIIVMERDPVAVGWSIFKRYFASRGNDYGYDLDDIVHAIRLCRKTVAFYDALLPGRLMRLDIARLTAEPERTIRALIDHCGLAFEPGCLAFHTLDRAVVTASAGQVRRKIHIAGADAWRPFAHHLGPLLAAFGADGAEVAATADRVQVPA